MSVCVPSSFSCDTDGCGGFADNLRVLSVVYRSDELCKGI